MNVEKQYLNILGKLLEAPVQGNRTGVDAHKIPPTMLQHDMAEGFPLLTTKKVAWKTLKVELEGFIKGETSKKWFQDRGCKIWNEWANPQKAPYGHDDKAKAKMAAEDDLGPCIYGASWRGFHDPTAMAADEVAGHYVGSYNVSTPVDQMANIVETLKTNPLDRRMICLAWNPMGLKHTALPACHVLWQVTTRGDYLDLSWFQRSVDFFLGVSFNLGSYALLLHLLCKETGLKPGVLTGFLSDVHLYVNHEDQAREQLSRETRRLPGISTQNWNGVFNWSHEDTELIRYNPHPPIKAPVAV